MEKSHFNKKFCCLNFMGYGPACEKCRKEDEEMWKFFAQIAKERTKVLNKFLNKK